MSSSLRQSANGRSASHRHGAPKHAAHQQNGALEVYAPHFAALYKIPQHDVFHIPPAHLNVTRLVLCAHFSPEAPCPVGNRCKFVHADVSHAEVCEIHVNYAYRTLDEVEYERFAAGQLLSVSQPNGKAPVVMIPSDCVLKTRALEVAQSRAAANGQSAAQQAAPRLSHCAHYYFNRTCHQGPKCQFVHAVYLDPRASRHQRAPVPHTQDHHDGRRGHQDDAHHHDDDDSDFVAPFAGAASGDYVPTTEQLSSRHHSGSSGSLVESAEVASDCESAGCASSAELHPVVSTPPSSLRASCRSQALSAHKYRYNPYDMVTAIVCM